MRIEGWFSHVLRVRYQETDQMGVVYHTNYLNWFEIARTELIRELGMPYRIIERRGLLLPVTEVELKYSQPARYDDLITIHTRIIDYSHIRIQFIYEIRRYLQEQGDRPEDAAEETGLPLEGDLLVTGMTKHVWLNTSWKPVRIDKEAPDLYKLIQDNFPKKEG